MEHIKAVNGRWGKCYYVAGDAFVGASLEHYGEYNPDETEHILRLAHETGGVVLDVGANIGTISQALAHEGFEVVAFEPQSELFKLLEKNCPSVKCLNFAVAHECGKAQMPLLDYTKPNNFGGFGLLDSGEGVEVNVVTLDSLNINKRVGLIKIDVEGWEEEVLRGAVELIARDKPIIYLEADRQERLASLYEFLVSLGYDGVRHNPTLYREENYFGKKENIWGRNYASYNWECRYAR